MVMHTGGGILPGQAKFHLVGGGASASPPPPNRQPNSANFTNLFCRFVGFLNFADLFCRFVGVL